MEISALLWCIFNNYKFNGQLPLPKDGRVSFLQDNNMKKGYWSSIGYIKLDKFALRVDVFERVFFIARQKIKTGPFIESADLMNPVGCNSDQLKSILSFCGFEAIKLVNDKILYSSAIKRQSNKSNKTNFEVENEFKYYLRAIK